MARISLNVVPARKNGSKPPGYKPVVTFDQLEELTKSVVAAPDMGAGAAALRKFARRLPDRRGGWKRYLRRLARALASGRPLFQVFKLKGNRKLPFATFSALPATTCPGAGECLDWCYSYTAWRYPAAWCRQVQNTLFLWHAKGVVRDAFLGLPAGIVVRLYVDGDFDSYATVNFWMALLEQRPDLAVYGYSKSWRLLHDYAMRHSVPANYQLNLSSGGREQGITIDDMMRLPFVRGRFVAVPVHYRPEGVTGNIGAKRYDDPNYHRAVRAAAEGMGLGKVLSCPGRCGECCGGRHACADPRLKGLTIAIGIH